MQVDVLDPASGQQVFSCTGPDSYGRCSSAPTAEMVPCEGYLLQTRSGQSLLDGYRFKVARSSPTCPLRCFSLGLI